MSVVLYCVNETPAGADYFRPCASGGRLWRRFRRRCGLEAAGRSASERARDRLVPADGRLRQRRQRALRAGCGARRSEGSGCAARLRADLPLLCWTRADPAAARGGADRARRVLRVPARRSRGRRPGSERFGLADLPAQRRPLAPAARRRHAGKPGRAALLSRRGGAERRARDRGALLVASRLGRADRGARRLYRRRGRPEGGRLRLRGHAGQPRAADVRPARPVRLRRAPARAREGEAPAGEHRAHARARDGACGARRQRGGCDLLRPPAHATKPACCSVRRARMPTAWPSWPGRASIRSGLRSTTRPSARTAASSTCTREAGSWP